MVGMPQTKPTAAPRGQQRRDAILRTALALFNAADTGSVTTNHIAAELGISVGNLYWHFRDKAAIVRALFAEHVERYDTNWTPPDADADPAEATVAALRRSFAITWDYRCLYRELATLTRADPELRRMHAEVRERRRAELGAFVEGLVALGVLRLPADPAVAGQLQELSWMVTTFWQPHVDLRDGTVTKRAVAEGVRSVLALYLPYVEPRFAKAMTRALDG
jgi:AcrR family transcriptional regulator